VNDLQALITGTLVGALMGQMNILVDPTPVTDAEGNYEPWFYVVGRNSGTKLKVTVEVVE